MVGEQLGPAVAGRPWRLYARLPVSELVRKKIHMSTRDPVRIAVEEIDVMARLEVTWTGSQ